MNIIKNRTLALLQKKIVNISFKNQILLLLLASVSMFLFTSCDTGDPPPPPNTGPIPRIYINTENGQAVVSKEDYLNATFVLDGEGTDWDNMEETALRIRGRGNSTWGAPKKPYRLNFNTATSLFGLPAARNWVLLANYYDKTQLFNTVAFEIGQRLGMPHTNHSFFVELYLNGKCQGLYQLTEHISSNVPLSGDDILMEIDANFDETFQFYSDIVQLPVMLQNPSNQATLDRAKVIWDNIEKTLFAPVYENTPVVLDSNSGWWDLINIESLMQYFLVYEIMLNTEPLWPNSVNIRYLENDDKIHFGPIWDFDNGWTQSQAYPWRIERINWGDKGNMQELLERELAGSKLFYRFFDDPKFVREYKEYCKNTIGKLDHIGRFIDSLTVTLKPYAEKDFQIWNQLYDYELQANWFKNLYHRRIYVVKNYVKF